VKAGKSATKSSSDRRLESSHDTSGRADSDSCMITDETVLADKPTTSATNTTTRDRPQQTMSKPLFVGKGSVSDTSAPARTVAENAEVTETAAKSTSRLFDLVNTDSPVAHVS